MCLSRNNDCCSALSLSLSLSPHKYYNWLISFFALPGNKRKIKLNNKKKIRKTYKLYIEKISPRVFHVQMSNNNNNFHLNNSIQTKPANLIISSMKEDISQTELFSKRLPENIDAFFTLN